MRPALKTCFAFLTVALASCAAAPAAHAQTQRLYFTATIEAISNDAFGSSVMVGSLVSGYFQFSASAPDTSSSFVVGTYQQDGSPNGFFLSFGSYRFASVATSRSIYYVYNNFTTEGIRPFDGISLTTEQGELSGPFARQAPYSSMAQINLQDPSANAFSSDAIVSTPDLAAFPDRPELRVVGFFGSPGANTGSASITARLTSLSPQDASVIPEPSTAALAASGLLTLAGAAGRRRRATGTRSASKRFSSSR